MNQMSNCNRCNKPLKTERSIDTGYGPVCKRENEEAEAEFLKKQITVDEELAYKEKVSR